MKPIVWENQSKGVYSVGTKEFEPLLKLRAALDRLTTIDLSSRGLQWVTVNLTSLVNHQKLKFAYIVNPSPIYRGQILSPREGELSNVSRLWYPPRDKVLQWGRLNRVGQQVFYAASTPKAVFFELDLQPGDRVGLLECAKVPCQHEVKVVQLGIDRRFLSRIGNPIGLEEFVEKAEKEYKSNLIMDGIPINELSESFVINRFFHDCFSREVTDSNRDFYKLTIAIGEIWFHNPDIGGLAYPTMTNSRKKELYMAGHNVAFRKETVDQWYKPSRVWLCQCQSLSHNGYQIAVIGASKTITPSGEIIWSQEGPTLLPIG